MRADHRLRRRGRWLRVVAALTGLALLGGNVGSPFAEAAVVNLQTGGAASGSIGAEGGIVRLVDGGIFSSISLPASAVPAGPAITVGLAPLRGLGETIDVPVIGVAVTPAGRALGRPALIQIAGGTSIDGLVPMVVESSGQVTECGTRCTVAAGRVEMRSSTLPAALALTPAKAAASLLLAAFPANRSSAYDAVVKENDGKRRAELMVQLYDKLVAPTLAGQAKVLGELAAHVGPLMEWRQVLVLVGLATSDSPDLADRDAAGTAAVAEQMDNLFLIRVLAVDILPPLSTLDDYIGRTREIADWVAAVSTLRAADDPIVASDVERAMASLSDLHARFYDEVLRPRVLTAVGVSGVRTVLSSVEQWLASGQISGFAENFDKIPGYQHAYDALGTKAIAEFDRLFPPAALADPNRTSELIPLVRDWLDLARDFTDGPQPDRFTSRIAAAEAYLAGPPVAPVSAPPRDPSRDCVGGSRPAIVYDARVPDGARSPFDARPGLLFIVTPAVRGLLSDVAYPSAAGAVSVDGVPLTPGSGVGEHHAVSVGGALVWRAVEGPAGDLYLEIYATSGPLPRAITAGAITGCPAGSPASTFTIDLGLPPGTAPAGTTPGGTVPVTTVPVPTVPATTVPVTTVPPALAAPWTPPTGPAAKVCAGVTSSGGLAGGAGRFAVAAQAPACGIELDGRIIATIGDALDLIERWHGEITLRRTQLLALPSPYRPVLDPIVDTTIRLGDTTATRLFQAKTLDDTLQGLVVDWYVEALRTLAYLESEESRAFLAAARDKADATRKRQMAMAREAAAALQERQRRAFCIAVDLCETLPGDVEPEPGELEQLHQGIEATNEAIDEFDEGYEQLESALEVVPLPPAVKSLSERVLFSERVKSGLASVKAVNAWVGKGLKVVDDVKDAWEKVQLVRPTTTEMQDLDKGMKVFGLALDAATNRLTAAQSAMIPMLSTVEPMLEAIGTLMQRDREQWVTGLNRLHFESGSWGSVRWEVEIGGRPMAEYLLAVYAAKAPAFPPLPPAAVARIFVEHQDLFASASGSTEDFTSGVPLITEKLDPAVFPAWVLVHRDAVWASIYGSRRRPARVTS